MIFNRLYRSSSSLEGGTLFQLRNLINQRNIKQDISGKFNEATDFFELVVTAYIVAAALHFFGMKSVTDIPTKNSPCVPSDRTTDLWAILQASSEKIVDRYVVVHESCPINTTTSPKETTQNPHVTRVTAEHSYCRNSVSQTPTKRKRRLPQWLRSHEQTSTAPVEGAPDGVFNYSSAVLNDGLLLLELRDAIREGDGIRVLRCWKFMLLYWRYGNHTKYCLEAFHLLASVNATATPRIAHEIIWCRFVNSRGGSGKNIPVDLFMEHLNRTVKDYLLGLGANISEKSIIQTSKSLRSLMDVTTQFDSVTGIHSKSIYHTSKDSSKDFEAILEELQTSQVFEYIPGRFHKTFKEINPHVSAHINTDRLFSWMRKHQKKIPDSVNLKNLLHFHV